MKKTIACTLMSGCAAFVSATELKQKGYFEVVCDDIKVSQHTTYHKALQSSLTHPGKCIVNAPSVEVIKQTILLPTNNLMMLGWETPTARENGDPLDPNDIKGYRMYWSYEGGPEQDSGIVTGNSYSLQLMPGTWEFRLATVTKDGIEGKKTPHAVIIAVDRGW